ncbi:MAG: potassium-transporting ATPase subunit KdpC [Kofleriaceae bacterium]|nr:potassium-transporting ATPase subunit KdpC [Kofleriaceae bacterium]
MRELVRAAKIFLLLTVLTGLVYPLLVTGAAQLLFSNQAHGSVITRNGVAVGSALIGQHFDQPGYLWGRPSATAPVPYNAAASGASNLGPTNPALVTAIAARVDVLRASLAEPAVVPVDLVTSSASGLDPDISPMAAQLQIARIAQTRGMEPRVVASLISAHTHGRTFGLFGEPTVRVLAVNLALDALPSVRSPKATP